MDHKTQKSAASGWGGIAAEAAATISARTQELLASADEEQYEDDPFANCEEDEDELEENETVVYD